MVIPGRARQFQGGQSGVKAIFVLRGLGNDDLLFVTYPFWPTSSQCPRGKKFYQKRNPNFFLPQELPEISDAVLILLSRAFR